MTQPILTTSRLILQELTEADAPFILGLLNEPSFLRFIGDKGVRSLEDARGYIRTGPLASYAQHGFGLYLVRSRESAEPMGMCGLLRRDWLDAPDLGFSLLPAYWSRGYAFEAAAAVIEHGRTQYGIERILAITDPENRDSIRLLERLGFVGSTRVRAPDGLEDLCLFIRDSAADRVA